MSRENVEDFVRLVAPKSYYDGCKRLAQEPDLEYAIHIVEENGRSYLTVMRGKHRSSTGHTPTEDRHMVLPFENIGTIPWDVDKDYEITRKHAGGGAIGSEEETPWWKE